MIFFEFFDSFICYQAFYLKIEYNHDVEIKLKFKPNLEYRLMRKGWIFHESIFDLHPLC